MTRLKFTLQAEASGSNARATQFQTLHSTVQTPVFMPVGTQATVKSLRVEDLTNSGSQVLLANTYHLLLRPGPQVFETFGGIHRFMNWPKSVLTDSGGFQIFSLPHARTMTEQGAEFRSYVDGKWILLSPELSIATQKSIGSDIMMVLDQCVPSTSDYQVAEAAMHLTHRWAERSLKARQDSPQSMFAIIQGACFEDLRRESAKFLTELPFDGFAIGGLAVGETKNEREDFTALSAELLPRHLPRYLMGVGTPIDLLEAVHRGVDMFDCILPTALAQQGIAFTSQGKINLRRSYYKFADEVLDPECLCPTCAGYSRSYLHHLTKAGENLGWSLLSSHNLYFYHRLMADMRQHILADSFAAFYKVQRELLVRTDTDGPKGLPATTKKRKVMYSLDSASHELSATKNTSVKLQKEFAAEHKDAMQQSEVLRRDYLQTITALREANNPEPLIIWDLGLGTAQNVMSLIHFHESQESKRRLHIISICENLTPLERALHLPYAFPYIRHPAPYLAIKQKTWLAKDQSLQWEIKTLSQLAEAQQDTPELIFVDESLPETFGLNYLTSLFELKQRLGSCKIIGFSLSNTLQQSFKAIGFSVRLEGEDNVTAFLHG